MAIIGFAVIMELVGKLASLPLHVVFHVLEVFVQAHLKGQERKDALLKLLATESGVFGLDKELLVSTSNHQV